MELTRVQIVIAIILLVLTILVLLYVYYPRLSIYYFRIDTLLKDNQIKPIESNPEYLDLPLYQFYVNTSHNTYLDSMQHLTRASLDAYKYALKAGARYIEIDISTAYDSKGPIVCHGTDQYITTTSLSLKSVLDTINQHAFHTSDPLIIHIEMFSIENTKQNAIIVSMLKEAFGDKIVVPDDINFVSMRMRDLLNKVIIICRSYDPALSTIAHDNPQFQNYSDSSLPANGQPLNNMSRVYMHGCLAAAMSVNMDSISLRSKGYNCIAMNFQTRDSKLYDNLKFFKDYSFVPIKKD